MLGCWGVTPSIPCGRALFRTLRDSRKCGPQCGAGQQLAEAEEERDFVRWGAAADGERAAMEAHRKEFINQWSGCIFNDAWFGLFKDVGEAEQQKATTHKFIGLTNTFV